MILEYMVESIARDLQRESILVPVGVACYNSRLVYGVSIMSDGRHFAPQSPCFYGLGWIIRMGTPQLKLIIPNFDNQFQSSHPNRIRSLYSIPSPRYSCNNIELDLIAGYFYYFY